MSKWHHEMAGIPRNWAVNFPLIQAAQAKLQVKIFRNATASKTRSRVGIVFFSESLTCINKFCDSVTRLGGLSYLPKVDQPYLPHLQTGI